MCTWEITAKDNSYALVYSADVPVHPSAPSRCDSDVWPLDSRRILPVSGATCGKSNAATSMIKSEQCASDWLILEKTVF